MRIKIPLGQNLLHQYAFWTFLSRSITIFFFILPEMRFTSWDEQVTTMYMCFKFYQNFKSCTDGLVVCRLPCLDKHLGSNPVELMFCSRHNIFFLYLFWLFFILFIPLCAKSVYKYKKILPCWTWPDKIKLIILYFLISQEFKAALALR